MSALATGSTIGILGGGQLGRMLSIAATNIGFRCLIFAPEEHPCAASVAAGHVRAEYDDQDALAAFAARCDVLTYEFENVPAAPLRALGTGTPLHPNADALELAQDRLNEKDYILSHGGRPADYRAVDSLADLEQALEAIGAPAILKTRRFGYDGKGQARIRSADEAQAAWAEIGQRPAVLEAMVPFEREFSIILARGHDGDTRVYPAPDNRHEDGILSRSLAPGGGGIAEQSAAAADLARNVAEAIGYVGVLTFEFFASEDGPVFNEMAPRVHNSGHWTIEGAACSQFENHIRAICGLPLGSTALVAPRVEMTNLIGVDGEEAQRWLATEGAHLHYYDKGEARPGRKTGHVTQLFGE